MRTSRFFLLLTIIVVLLLAFYFFYILLSKSYKFSIKDLWSKGTEIKETKGNASIEKEAIETKNESLKTNESISQSNEASIVSQILTTQQKNYTKPLTLKIVDICSGKFENVYSISEGTRKCLNAPSPYNILIEKNSTHFKTSILNENGFNETFEINDSVLIYFLFAEDVATISKEIEKIYLEGSDYFFLGNYELQTIWEADSSGNLYISKMIVVLPLYVKKEIEAGNYTLTFYLSALNRTFYLGGTTIFVKRQFSLNN
jgi:hypothetical protein